MALKQKGTDAAAADPKKRRRVGFSGIGTNPDPRRTRLIFRHAHPVGFVQLAAPPALG
jgi:histone acetyltransferase 1